MTSGWLRMARRIAVIRLDRLGDMFLTFPMFRALREIAPGAELHLLCRPYTSPAAQGIACIDQVHTVSSSSAFDEIEAALRQARLDVVFMPLHDPGQTWAAWRARVPHRVGTGRRTLSLLNNHWIFAKRSWRSGKHEAVLNVEMVSTMLRRPLETRLVAPRIEPATVVSLRSRLQAAGVPDGARLLVVHPGSGGSAPATWDAEHFGHAALVVARDHQLQVVVTGSPDEAPLVNRVLGTCPGAIGLAGALTLPELIALLSSATLVITNCTGPMHVATVFDTPVVGALPDTDVARWHPLNPRGGWVASRPGARDLGGITVDAFVTEMRRVLAL